ncbi:MAG: hypothetical protein H0V37_04040 [Chloroflexia bacterium]|nr:hypothetical protein [Chloroflexia bacterium]
MRTSEVNLRRPLIVFVIALLGLMALTTNPASAYEGCVPEDDRAFLALVDPTEGDGS